MTLDEWPFGGPACRQAATLAAALLAVPAVADLVGRR